TIAQLARVVEHEEASALNEAEQGTVSGAVALTPIQHWFFEQQQPEPHYWNQAFLLSVKAPVDAKLLQQAFEQVVEHHDVLRTRFSEKNGVWSQHIAAQQTHEQIAFSHLDLSRQSKVEQKQTIEQEVQHAHAVLDICAGPLVRAVWFDAGAEQDGRFLIVIHHLLIDGVSWRILLDDLQSVYTQMVAGKTVKLPHKTTSFQQWAQQLQSYAADTRVSSEELNYWLGQTNHTFQHLPIDYQKGANTVASVRHIQQALSKEETRALLQDVPLAFHTQINDVLLTALALALLSWTGERALFLNLESHGREELHARMDLSRTVGWFTSLHPLLLDLRAQGGSQPLNALCLIKEQIRQIPRKGI